jgi:hypothetical protein
MFTDIPYTRTLIVSLAESDWRALREVEPDAVGWLQLQVRNRLSSSDAPQRAAASRAQGVSVDDDY